MKVNFLAGMLPLDKLRSNLRNGLAGVRALPRSRSSKLAFVRYFRTMFGRLMPETYAVWKTAESRCRSRILSYLSSLRGSIAGAGSRVKLRVRISLIAGTAIGGGVLLIGSFVARQEAQTARMQTEILGKTIVANLADIAKDNLILNSASVIQENVSGVGNRKIPGLLALSVFDRTGVIVAHTVVDSIYHRAPLEIWNGALRADSLEVFENDAETRFIEPIFVYKQEGQIRKRILLGGAWATFSKAVSSAAIKDLYRTIGMVSAGVAFSVVVLFFLLAGKFVQIGVALSEAARLVKQHHARGTEGGGDIVKTLTREIDMMVRQIHEKGEMEKLVSPVAKQVILNHKQDLFVGTRRVIAVMFTDIRNFTSISGQLWPEEVIELLNHYLDIQTRIIHEYNGLVDKFIGDGIMGIFAEEKMVYDAVSAAIEIQKRIALLNTERASRNEIVLEIGVGIAVGRVVLGSVGSRQRMDYTAIGDTVNLAARLCQAAGGFQILVTQDVVSRIYGRIPVLEETKISVKGIKEQVPVSQIQYTFS